MKILVATKETQGQRKNDFNWCNEGEAVTFAFECDGEKIDGRCGCRRSMSGTTTLKATTTMKVVESEMSKDSFKTIICNSLKNGGWLENNSEADNLVEDDVNELLRIASEFPVNSIIEKRGNKFQKRLTSV